MLRRRAEYSEGAATLLALLALLGAAGLLGGCSSSQKKLSSGGSATDFIVYDVLKKDRDPDYYYELVRDSHDKEKFCYRCSDDVFLVDKSVDAVQKLGGARVARLEGQAQVVALLTDVLLEDPSALAQANAANSMTRIGLKLPQYRSRGLEERGDYFLSLLKELDAMYAQGGLMCSNPAAGRARVIQILDTIGNFEMATLMLAKDTLKPFYTRDFLIDSKDAGIRQANDTALVKRMGEVIRMALRAAVDADMPYVREEAIRGLKTLGDRLGEDAVLARLQIEPNWRVRAEAVEYLGRIASANAVEALLPMLEDADPSLRFKTREALTRIAGKDLGFRRRTWERWAKARYPELARREEASDDPSPLPERMR